LDRGVVGALVGARGAEAVEAAVMAGESGVVAGALRASRRKRQKQTQEGGAPKSPQRLVVKVKLGRCWVAGLGCMQFDVWRSFGLASTVRAA
jgi:hypothetical protein